MPKFFLKVKNLPNGIVEIEEHDTELIQLYTTIALHEYEKNRFKHGNPLDNFLGIAGELAFRKCLEDLGLRERVDFEYAERRLDYWKKDPRKWDFKLKNGKTIEIVTIKPHHEYCILKESDFKRSNYAVCVKIRWLKCFAEIKWEGKYGLYGINANRYKPIPITDKEDLEILKERCVSLKYYLKKATGLAGKRYFRR